MCSFIGSAIKLILTKSGSTPFEESAMSFVPVERARRNIGVRLGLWYAFIFALGSFALLVIAYYLLAAAIGRKDQEVLQARLREYATIYANSGLSGLRRAVQREGATQQTFYVRLVTPWNDVSFANVPD